MRGKVIVLVLYSYYSEPVVLKLLHVISVTWSCISHTVKKVLTHDLLKCKVINIPQYISSL